MGGGQSGVRASHFQNENAREELPESEEDDAPHLISISNKMVERLVEDAAVAGGAAAAMTTPSKTEKHVDVKDKILTEKLNSLDDSHSEKVGLTLENVKATAKRIELRTAHLTPIDPVCQECADKVVECYNSCDRVTNAARCAEVVNAFAKCVQETSVSRCRARMAREAIEAARRTRHVAQARHLALKDLSIPPEITT